MSETVATAPAKLILAGEHAVLHGHPAIAVPFPALQTRVTVTAGQDTLTSDRYLGQRVAIAETRNGPLAPLCEALREVRMWLDRMDRPWQPVEVAIHGDIPPGSGLGSSASVLVAAIRAAFAHHGSHPPVALVRQMATRAESLAHGTSSGLDPATVSAPGPIQFIKGHAPVELRIGRPFTLVVADSGRAVSTRDQVARVQARVESEPAARMVLDRFEGLANRVAEALEYGELEALGLALDDTHEALVTLGASDDSLDGLVRVARSAGALGAKLSGAGGGGCVLALAPDGDGEAIAAAWRDLGCPHVWTQSYPEPA
ncbi:MAG: mevalonate kinase [bacterium]|nr:mevalonate kinase [bacterium]